MRSSESGCTHARRALEERAAGDERVPTEAAIHLAGCEPCRAAWAAEREAVSRWRSATERVAALPAFDRVVGALGERRRAERVRTARAGWALGAGLVAAAVAVTLIATPGARELPEDGAALSARAGLVSVARDGAWQAVAEGDQAVLGAADAVETGLDGEASLARPGVATVAVGPATRLALRAWRDADVIIDLERGALTADVRHRAPGERFAIHTPTARVEVVGTRFVTRHDPRRGTTVEGQSGTVRVYRADTGELAGVVRAGERLSVPLRRQRPATTLAASEPASARTAASAVGSPAPASVAASVATPASVAAADPVAASVAGPVAAADPASAAASASAVAPASRAARASSPARTTSPPTPARATSPAAAARASESARGDAEARAGRPCPAADAYARALPPAAVDPGPLVVDLGEAELACSGPARARARWSAHLRRFPGSPVAAAVALRLAPLERDRGAPDEAERLWRLALAAAPNGPAAALALTALGRHLLARGAFTEAADLFVPFAVPAHGRLGEAALVGLMHARRGEGRSADVEALAAAHKTGWPDGSRRPEVEALRARPDEAGSRPSPHDP